MVKDREEEVVEAENEVWTQIKQIFIKPQWGTQIWATCTFYKARYNWPNEAINNENKQGPSA